MPILKKQVIEKNVYDSAIERINYLYDNFDKVVVSFSGGKDSTVILNLTLQVARERGKLPLDVIFFDEEAIHPPTIEYVERIRQNPDINLKWYCLEVKHRNACSRKEPWWYNWEKGKEDVWTRPMPENVILEHPNFIKGMTIPEFCPKLFPQSDGRVVILTGIRADESLRRYRVVAKREKENYINQNPEDGNVWKAHPIYDWVTNDVWVAPQRFGWDYNKTYDLFEKAGQPRNKQRVCPPYGEEPLRGLWIYAECFPEMWHKMLYRVHGCATAWRYANTELYSMPKEPPNGMTWKEYLFMVMDLNFPKERKEITENINRAIKIHNKKSKHIIHDSIPDPITGMNWKDLCFIVIRGDLKGRRLQALTSKTTDIMNKKGLTMKDMIETDGNTRY